MHELLGNAVPLLMFLLGLPLAAVVLVDGVWLAIDGRRFAKSRREDLDNMARSMERAREALEKVDRPNAEFATRPGGYWG